MATLNKWSGYFSSSVYSFIITFVKGSIDVELGEPGSEFVSDCKVKYTGRYRYNQEITGSLHGKGDSFECHVGGMTINFKVGSRSERYISGTYSIESPYDEGTFNLARC